MNKSTVRRLLILVLALQITSAATASHGRTSTSASALSRLIGCAEITTHAWSDDGQMLALGTAHEIRVYPRDASEPILMPVTQTVTGLVFHQDNTVLASAEHTGLVRVWDTASGEMINTWGIENIGSARSLYFIPNTTLLTFHFSDLYELMTGATLGTGIHVWAYQTPQEPRTIPTSTYFGENNLTINRDSEFIATSTNGSQNRSGLNIATLLIRDFSSGEIVQQMTYLRTPFNQLLFSPTDPDRLVSIDRQGVVRFWDARQGRELFALTLPYYHMTSIAFSPDGTHLATGGTDGKVRLWSVEDGALLEVFAQQPQIIQQLRFQTNGDLYAFSDARFSAQVWNVRTGAIIADYQDTLACEENSAVRFHLTDTDRLMEIADGAKIANEL